MKSMSVAQFVVYCEEALPEMAECLGDMEAQYRSECAQFGDAGPGQGLLLQQARREYADLKRQYDRVKARS